MKEKFIKTRIPHSFIPRRVHQAFFTLHILFLVGPVVSGLANPAQSAMKQGLEYYASGQYSEAAESFSEAGTLAKESTLDPATALFNKGNALYKTKQHEEASEAYREALKTSDLTLQSKTYFNEGNNLFALADSQEKENRLQAALEAIKEAVAMYENAMQLDPKDEDPKINYEVAQIKIADLKERIEQQQQNQESSDDQEEQDQQQDSPEDHHPQDGQDQQQQDEDDEGQNSSEEDQNQENQDPSPAQGKEQDQESEPQQSGEPQAAPEEMTPEEAIMMLEAMREEEEAEREKMRVKLGKPIPVDQDW
ncbi:MAG: tetratricopeptide repeat protein [Kiritimatiellae bacterium]|nr:tetratricopeptide repeat protein [Kiritimatiellia bacterium]